MYKIRRATIDDIPTLIEIRRKLFEPLVENRDDLVQMSTLSESYFLEKLENEEVIAWLQA